MAHRSTAASGVDRASTGYGSASSTMERSGATPDPNYVSETESDTSSVLGDVHMGENAAMRRPSQPVSREQLHRRIDSLAQENKVLKVEVEAYKIKIKSLQSECNELRKASVDIQAKAEQEEDFISNTLTKKITELKREKETLAQNYEQEEECLTNELTKQLHKLRSEKAELAQKLKNEQEGLVGRLLSRIEKLESETANKQSLLDRVRREKVELENTLEQEQESLVNRLWKKMEKLENEKRFLQNKLDVTASAPPSPMPMDISQSPQSARASLSRASPAPPPQAPPPTAVKSASTASTQASHSTSSTDSTATKTSHDVDTMTSPSADSVVHASATATATGARDASVGGQQRRWAHKRSAEEARQEQSRSLISHIEQLRSECAELRARLDRADNDRQEREQQLSKEEAENLRLRRKLELETERRTELFRHLSESESSLEMEDERVFNELSMHGAIPPVPASAGAARANPTAQASHRPSSSPIAFGRMSPANVGAGVGAPSAGGLNVAVNFQAPSSTHHAAMAAYYLQHGVGPVSPSSRCAATCYACGAPTPVAMMAAAAAGMQHAAAAAALPLGRTRSSGSQSGQSSSVVTSTAPSAQASHSASSSFARPANPPSAPPPSTITPTSPRQTASRSRTPDARHK